MTFSGSIKIITESDLIESLDAIAGRYSRSSRPEMFCKKVFLEISQNSLENTAARASLFATFFKKEALAHVLSYEVFEISIRTPFITE